jgi:hypothetical protein
MGLSQALSGKLQRQLAYRGWRRVGVQPLARFWCGEVWRGEVWHLASLRPPLEVSAYVVFVSGDSPETLRWVFGGESPWADDYVGGWRIPAERQDDELIQSIFGELDYLREQATPPAPHPSARAFTEEAWLAAVNPEALLRRLAGRLDERKLRLFACACCRRLSDALADPRNLRAVELAEAHADGLVPKREMKKARKAAHLPWLESFDARDEAAQALRAVVAVTPAAAQAELCSLLRDLSGHLFIPVKVRPSWLSRDGGAARTLAEVIYREGRFEELPVLADALEDAGCADEVVLGHCRSELPHARGCWLLDALLGKARANHP